MPNWCDNKLVVMGPRAELERFLAHARKRRREQPDEAHALVAELAEKEVLDPLDFENFVPTPAEFEGISTGGCTIDGKSVSAWREVRAADGTVTRIAVTEEELQAYRERYGTDNWYEWRLSSWGTKWNACHADEWRMTKRSATLYFDTAWSPPTPVIQAMGEQWPKLRFHLNYAEGGCGFQGDFCMAGGKVTVEESRDYRGTRGG